MFEEGENGEGAGKGGNYQGSERTEQLYDPISGKVAYGKVFEAYYAEYLEALETGDVPEYLQKIMDAYYTSLS